jgi:hypothetical protein
MRRKIMKAAEMREVMERYERYRVAMGQSLPLDELKLIAQTMFPAGSLPDESDPIGFTNRELEIIRNLQWKTEATRQRWLRAEVERGDRLTELERRCQTSADEPT